MFLPVGTTGNRRHDRDTLEQQEQALRRTALAVTRKSIPGDLSGHGFSTIVRPGTSMEVKGHGQ
jgi:hypothetical protein